MVTKKAVEPKSVQTVPRDPERSSEIFAKAKEIYLKSETNADNLQQVITMFEESTALDPANKDAQAYLNYARRDLSGLQRKKKGVTGGHTRSRSKSEAKEDILAAYETDEESTDDESELYGDDEEAEAPPWDPVAAQTGEEEQPAWES